MSHIVRIDRPASHTHGWQARAPIPGSPRRYVSRFFADKAHGCDFAAYALANAALRGLQREARAKAKAPRA